MLRRATVAAFLGRRAAGSVPNAAAQPSSAPRLAPFSRSAASRNAKQAAEEGAEASKEAGGWLKVLSARRCRPTRSAHEGLPRACWFLHRRRCCMC
jgi:hypothetical protein